MATSTAKKLGFSALAAIAIGNVVGSGIVTLIGSAMKTTGLSAWLAYGLTVILGFFTIIPFIFIGSTLVLRGGEYTIITNMLGELFGGIYSVAGVTYCITVALMGKAVSTYICAMIPGANPTVVGIITITVFYLLNMGGVNLMAKVQQAMTWVLIGSLVLFVILGLTHIGNPDVLNFSSPDFFSEGYLGFTKAISIFAFSVHAQYMVINFGADAQNPRKDIPRAIILASGIIFVLYVLVGIVACGVLPFAEARGATLLPTAKFLMGNLGGTIFVIVGPLFAIFTTVNSYYSARALPMIRSTQDGWFPSFVGKTNRFGAPSFILTFFWVVATILLLGGAGIISLANNLSLISTVLRLISAIAIIRLPTLYPEAWEKSGFHVPNGVFYVIMAISCCSSLYIAYLALRSLNLTVAIANVSVFVISGIYATLRKKAGKVKIVNTGSISEIETE